jgi:hypothetical protein
MSYLKIDPNEIKLAGGGAKLQWGLVVGVAVDKFVAELARMPSDSELISAMKSHLNTPGVIFQVDNPAKLSASQKHVVDSLFKATGTKLTHADLHRVFD